MDPFIQIETGVQLLARLTKRPSLQGLEEILFSDGPRHNEVVEVSGNLSSGKTLLTTQLIAKCLLPRTYKNFQLDGLDAGAVFVNTDHHFHIPILVNLMASYIRKKKITSDTEQLDNEMIKDIIENSLRHLTVINCYESSQFILSLHSLQTILSNDNKIAIIAIDSMSSYYWQDRENRGIWSMDGYLKNCLKLMQKCTCHHKVVLLYTRPSDFESKGREVTDCASAPEEEKINYKIQLHKREGTNEFSAVVESAIDKRNLSYTIDDNGIEWKVHNRRQS